MRFIIGGFTACFCPGFGGLAGILVMLPVELCLPPGAIATAWAGVTGEAAKKSNGASNQRRFDA